MRVGLLRPTRHSKAQHIVVAFVPALIVVLSITGFVWARKEVTVVVDGRSTNIRTQAPDVASALGEAGIPVRDGDVVSPAVDASLKGGMTVVVRHAVPVTVDLGGERVQLDVVGETVADAIIAAGADPSANPSVTPSLDATLHAGMEIEIPDVFVRVLSEEVTVAPDVRTEPDSSLPRGTRRVITAGRPGTALNVYRVLVAGGVEGAPVLTASEVIEQPVASIVVVGTGDGSGLASGSSPSAAEPPTHGRRMRVVATGYSPQQPDLDFTTATGARAEHGVIAVDPDVIPLGTRVYVPGYGYAVAADTGGAIDGNRIDLCYDTVAEALQWGRRTVTIIILD